MPDIRIPTPLRPYTAGQSAVKVNAANVAAALQDLTSQHPGLEKHIYNEVGELRPYVNLFVNDEDIRHLQGIDTPVTENDRLMIIPSIAGG